MIDVVDASPSEDGDWFVLRSEKLKQHLVHKCNLSNLIIDLELRNFSSEIDHAKQTYIEYKISSMMIYGRPLEIIRLDCLDIKILSRDVMYLIEEMNSLKIRTFADGSEYYKIKSSFCCLVLTKEQFYLLWDELISIYIDANERDILFMDEWKKSIDNKRTSK